MKSEELLKELQLLTAKPALKSAIEARASSRPSSALTEDELCRQAILRVGTAEQFGPSSQAMLLAKSLYPQVRDALLLTGSWTWAMKSTTVAETLPRPEYKWAYRYAIPSDCLRVFRVNDWDSAAADSAWEVAGNFVLTNADSGAPDWVAGRAYEVGNVVSSASAVYVCRVANTTKEPGVTSGWTTDWDVWLGSAIQLEYVRKATDVTLFDSLFIDLLTANLAAKLAVPLTGDANKAALLSKEVEVLGKNPAMRRDSTERKGKIKPAWTSSKLVSSRSGGDGIDQAKATAGGPGGGVSYPSLLVTVGSVTNLPTGSTPTVSNTGTGNTAVLNFGLPQGPAGTVNIGTTTTGAEGTNASVTATGTPENRILSFTIPRGNKGDIGLEGPAGTPATVAIGTTTTGNAGTNAAVTNTGTASAGVFNFTIPRGNTGEAGPANSLSIGTVSTGTAGTLATATITGTAPSQTLSLSIPRGDAGLGNAFYSLTPPAAPSAGDLWWKTDTKQLYVFQSANWAEVNGRNDEFPVIDLDAQSYIAAVEAADAAAGFTGGLEQAVKDALTMFVVNAKLDGIWPAIKASCILAGARSLDGALTPLAGTAPTNINFTPADYDRKTGLIGDGSNKYLNANRNNNQNAETSSHYAVYLTAKGTINGRYYLGGTAAVAGGSFLYMSSATQVLTRLNNSTSTTSTTHSTGLLAVSRGNNADYTLRNNGTNFTIVQPSVAPGSFQVSVFSGTDGTLKANARMSFYSIGESIDLAKLDSRISILMSQLNTAIL